MLEELPRRRQLRDEEKFLLFAMLRNAPLSIIEQINNSTVEDMTDGNMGSVRFTTLVNEEERLLGKTIAEASYVDIDNIQVLISINVDKRGGLFEIDFWKTDFSALISYPKPEQLLIKN